MIGKEVTVTIDRPLNSVHPKYKDMIYPIITFAGVIIAIIHRNDDVEEKWVVAPKGISFTLEEVKNATFFTEKYYDSEIRMK